LEISKQEGYPRGVGRKEPSRERYLGNLGGKKCQDGKVVNKGFRVCLDIKRESSSGISSIKEMLN
jgi:hypothetical protein